MLKIHNVGFVFLLVVGSWQTAQAQAPMSSYDYYIMRTQTINAAAANQTKGGAASEMTATKAIGEKKIKAGKASMSFTPTQVGLERFTKNVQYEPQDPQTLPEQILYVKNYVNRFNEMLTEAGGKINNCADAYALAYATSYMAYYDKTPDMAEVKTLRQKYLQENMSEPYFQGMSDADKQWYYNSWALMSLQAIDEREKASRAKSSREREEAEKKAKGYAEYALGHK